jgi:hypothetical protein
LVPGWNINTPFYRGAELSGTNFLSEARLQYGARGGFFNVQGIVSLRGNIVSILHSGSAGFHGDV